ncbi:MAG: hypothetical protein AAGF57_00650 [Pseudomonadota bacterium]
MAYVGRMYQTGEQAAAAVQALLDRGFKDELIVHVSPDVMGETITPAGLIKKVDVGVEELNGSLAVVFSRGLAQGRHIVVVNAEFGTGASATSALESANPLDAGGSPQVAPRNPTPLSSLIGMPALATRRLSMLSRLFPPLTRSSWLMFGSGLSKGPTPLSSMIGLKPLTEKKKKESSFGIPLLTKPKGERSSSFGLPLLIRNKER